MKKPIYYIVCHTWNTAYDDYDFIVHCQSTDADAVRKVFDDIELDTDTPLIELYLQGDDEDIRIAYKDLGGVYDG